MVKNSYSYILSFDSTSFAMAAEKILGQEFNITIIPTPREITQNCGIAIKFNNDDLTKIIDRIKLMAIPSVLYRVGNEEKLPRSTEVIMSIA